MVMHEDDDEGRSLVSLVKPFTDKIRDMKALMLMRTPDSFGEWDDTLQELQESLQEIERSIANLRQTINTEKACIPFATELKTRVHQQNEHIKYIQSHLPDRLPGNHLVQSQYAEAAKENLSSNIYYANNSSVNAPSYASTSISIPTHGPQDEPATKSNNKKNPKIDKIAYITVNELENTAKHIRGRLTLDKVNNAIDEVNSILIVKYKILSTPQAKLAGDLLAKYKAFKDQETKETKGIFFFSETDIKSSSLKSDATGKALLIFLRHHNRIKDLGGSMKRFAVVPN